MKINTTSLLKAIYREKRRGLAESWVKVYKTILQCKTSNQFREILFPIQGIHSETFLTHLLLCMHFWVILEEILKLVMRHTLITSTKSEASATD